MAGLVDPRDQIGAALRLDAVEGESGGWGFREGRAMRNPRAN